MRSFQRSQHLTRPASSAIRIRWVVLFAACALVCGCSGPEKPKVEGSAQSSVTQAPQQQSPGTPAPQQQMAKLPPPELDQIQQAVKRVFKDSALVDTARKPSYVAGDFNGDLSQDIAVILKPAPGKVADINQESPAWILKDIVTPNEPGKPPLRVAQNDVLLAVIHGYGPDGWRDSQATQTFLLKNAVGSDIAVLSGKEFVAANSDKKLPLVNGDLIGENLRGKPGYLYYAHATYAWYDPKTFMGEAQRAMIHERAPVATKK
jgi:hypothetical protein